jgi:hypothetical protein
MYVESAYIDLSDKLKPIRNRKGREMLAGEGIFCLKKGSSAKRMFKKTSLRFEP